MQNQPERLASLLDSIGRPKEIVRIVRLGKNRARINCRDNKTHQGFSPEIVIVDRARIIEDGGKAVKAATLRPGIATWFSSSANRPPILVSVSRAYKHISKARVYHGPNNGVIPSPADPRWSQLEDLMTADLTWDSGAGWLAEHTPTNNPHKPVPNHHPNTQSQLNHTGQKVGYLRVSTQDQNLERQRQLIGKVDQEFSDQLSAASQAPRPGLHNCLMYLRSGDTLVVASIDRLSRSLIDLKHIIAQIHDKGASCEFIKEGLLFSPDATDPQSTLMLGILGSFAEFERAIIKERQAEGIAIAKQKGKYQGRKKTLTSHQIADLHRRAQTDEPRSHIAASLGISRATLYRYLNQS